MPNKFNFIKEIKRDYNKWSDGVSGAVTRVALESWQKAVDATPKPPSDPPPKYQRTGRLAGSWKLNTGRNVGLIPAVGRYPDEQTKPNFVFDIKKHSAIQLWNNVPYAYYVEHGLGHQSNKPRKMLQAATDHFNTRIVSEFKKIR